MAGRPPCSRRSGLGAASRASALFASLCNNVVLAAGVRSLPNPLATLFRIDRAPIRAKARDIREQVGPANLTQWKSSSRPRASPASLTRLPGGSLSEPPRDAGVTTKTGNSPNRKCTSGSARSEKTGSEHSIDDHQWVARVQSTSPSHHHTKTERLRCVRRFMGSASRRQRSMKCSCEAELSFNSVARHLEMNAPGVNLSDGPLRRADDVVHYVLLNGTRARACSDPVLPHSALQEAVPCRRLHDAPRVRRSPAM